MRKRTRPEVFHGVMALAVALVVMVVLFAVFKLPFKWYYLLAGWLVAVNLTAFAYYGYDKARARGSSSRVPEVVLHGLAIAGGSLGCYAGMVTFRHKTIKSSFRFVFWFTVIFQVLLVIAVIYRVWKYSGTG